MASLREVENPSCIGRSRVRRPQSGAVRNCLAVSGGPFCTIPSPVPTSCSRKSPYGWILDHLVPQCLGYAEHAAIDRGPRRGRGDGSPVAEGTSNLGEDLLSRPRRRRGQQLCIHGWHRGTAHERSEVVDVFHADVTGFIFGILRGLAEGRGISGGQGAG